MSQSHPSPWNGPSVTLEIPSLRNNEINLSKITPKDSLNQEVFLSLQHFKYNLSIQNNLNFISCSFTKLNTIYKHVSYKL